MDQMASAALGMGDEEGPTDREGGNDKVTNRTGLLLGTLPGAEAWDNNKEISDVKLPALTEVNDIYQPCKDKHEEVEKDCDNLRKRVAEWLKNQGCPSVIRKYKTPKRTCARKKKPAAKRGCGCK